VTATADLFTLSLHDALPIFREQTQQFSPPVLGDVVRAQVELSRFVGHDSVLRHIKCHRNAKSGSCSSFCSSRWPISSSSVSFWRSEEHTSELQSRVDLVCRL